jgi:signal transduction histidine kinase
MAQVVDPDKLHENTNPPPVLVEDVIGDRKRLKLQPSLRIPPLTRDLQIDYTALSFTVPQKVLFRYMLEGHDDYWQVAGTRRQAFYTNLKPGNYRFRVIACNENGVWNEAGASLDFSIEPAYYQTMWFKVACAGFLLLLLWWAYQLRVRRLHRQFEIGLEARVAERTRIARDLHDTLLQSFHLSLLHFQSASNLLPNRPDEAKKKLDRALDQASDAIAEARGAVQGLRSPAIATSDLGIAIRTLGEGLGGNEPTSKSPSLEVAVEGEPRNLYPMVRDEVYRIAAEALRNAYRHAGASRIEVEIHYEIKQLRVSIRDDGKGIDRQVAGKGEHTGHYGLHGMSERAKLIGGNLEVWSDGQSGTEIEVTVPGSTAYHKQDFRQDSLRMGA